MDDRHDRIVRDYMEKILALRRERQQEELSSEELERIALESGLGKEDLDYARKSLNDHLSRGKGFLGYRNWSRAAEEFEQAAALSPNSVPILVDLATAVWNHGVTEGENSDKLRAMQYAERALQLDAGNTQAIRLVTHMTDYPKELFDSGEPSSVQGVFEGKQVLMVGPTTDERKVHKNARRTAIITLTVTFGVLLLGGLVPLLFFNSEPDTFSASDQVIVASPEMSPADAAAATDGAEFARQVMSFGREGTGPGRFNDARHIGTDGAGNIYVGEYGGGRVQVFDATGTFLTQWNMGDDFPMRGLAVSRDGIVFLVFRGEIHKYEGKTGKPLGVITYKHGNDFDDVVATPDGGLAAFWQGVRRDQNRGVSDDIVVFDREGRVTRIIENGVSGASNSMAVSLHLAVDGAENVYALDGHSGSIFKFDRTGRFVNRFGSSGDEPGQLRAPDGIAVDGIGRVYVSDFKGVQVFDADGRYLGVFDVEGAASGIAFNNRDEVLVVARDQVFTYAVDDGH